MRLLALVDSPDHVCCRYRIRAFEPALKNAGWSLDCQESKHSTFSRLAQLFAVSSYESVILQRRLLPAWQLAILRRSARHLVSISTTLSSFATHTRGAARIRTCGKSGSPPRSGLPIRSSRVTISWPTVLSGRDARLAVRVIPTCVEPARYPKRHHCRPGRMTLVDATWSGSARPARSEG